jgi:hypothetical protein
MSTEDSDYYHARAIQERAHAADCGAQSIASIHLELATKYEALAADADMQPALQFGGGGMAEIQPA